jgi:hypothetical protein
LVQPGGKTKIQIKEEIEELADAGHFTMTVKHKGTQLSL